jgi:hypothetical protein
LFLKNLHNSLKEKKEVIEEEHIPGGFDDWFLLKARYLL